MQYGLSGKVRKKKNQYSPVCQTTRPHRPTQSFSFPCDTNYPIFLCISSCRRVVFQNREKPPTLHTQKYGIPRNYNTPLVHYYLNFQEFTNADDTCYLAHCYPYTYTDLKDDLDRLLAQGERAKVMKREVMCETRAGNSCFLITVTNFGKIVYSRQCLGTYQKHHLRRRIASYNI